jgi:hypothetical protein
MTLHLISYQTMAYVWVGYFQRDEVITEGGNLMKFKFAHSILRWNSTPRLKLQMETVN